MTEIDILKAQIVRQDVSQPWGFRLQGGADVGEPLSINRVTPGSPAARIGLKSGDQITEIYENSTAHLTQQEALDFIDQHGLSLIITIERNARGSIPVNPVLQYQSEYQPPKNYQPLDMSGGSRPRTRPVTVTIGYDMNNYVAQSRPFEAPPGRPQRYEQPVSNQQMYPQHSDREDQLDRYQAQYLSGPAPAAQGNNYSFDEEDYPARSGHPQSRTFRQLQSVMQNEEPVRGEAGLPPPRSAFMEQQQRQYGGSRSSLASSGSGGGSAGGGRMKVFTAQAYNSPMGLYSNNNLMETFAVQAESMLGTLESQAEHDAEPHPVYGSNGLLQ